MLAPLMMLLVLGRVPVPQRLHEETHLHRSKLVLWTSKPREKWEPKVRLLVPVGWKLQSFSPYDLNWRPRVADKKSPDEYLYLTIRVPGYHARGPLDRGLPPNKQIVHGNNVFFWRVSRGGFLAFLDYRRSNRAAFTVTRTAICRSLAVLGKRDPALIRAGH